MYMYGLLYITYPLLRCMVAQTAVLVCAFTGYQDEVE